MVKSDSCQRSQQIELKHSVSHKPQGEEIAPAEVTQGNQ